MSTAPFTTRACHEFTEERIEAPDVHPGLSRRATITGIGLLTPLGSSAPETWGALLDGRAISDHARAAGEFDHRSPRVVQMARRVADEAMRDAGWCEEDHDDVVTVVGTSKGSIESWLSPLQHMPQSTCVAGGFQPAGLGDIAAAIVPGAGARLTLSGACASGLLALIRGALLIESGEARRVLVVAAEASVHPLFLASFSRLGILAPPHIGCRPFDQARQGFLMSEAAAAVCLESDVNSNALGDMAGGQPARIAIESHAQGADAAHITSPDPDGRVLRYLVDKVARQLPVDLIHAHGTGTLANDPIELAALDSVVAGASRSPCLYSHKAALGHSLGAAGLVSVVLNVIAHRDGVVPPNLHTTHPLDTRHLAIHPELHPTPIRRSLSIAAGFGGAIAAVSLKSC